MADYPQPAGRDPAPPELQRVQDFVNTLDIEAGHDELRDTGALEAWLRAHQLRRGGEDPATDDDLSVAQELREAVRDAATANHDRGPMPPHAAQALSRAAARASVELHFGDEGDGLAVTADGVAGGLGRLALEIHQARADGRWSRLKACANHGCRWVYYDRSRSRTSRWCSMAICGNRAKVAAFAQRQNDEASCE